MNKPSDTKTLNFVPQDQQFKSKLQLQGWILIWFYVTAIVCTWDATFIMLRPHTLPGGSLAVFWYLYKYYVTVDQRYNDISDPFVFAQSLLNYGEVAFNIITIVMHYRCSRHTATTAFTVSVMTFWKTVLYFLMFSEFCTGGEYRQGNTVLQEIALVVIPNIIWVIMPLIVMYSLWEKLTPEGSNGISGLAVMTNHKSDFRHATQYSQTVQNGGHKKAN